MRLRVGQTVRVDAGALGVTTGRVRAVERDRVAVTLGAGWLWLPRAMVTPL